MTVSSERSLSGDDASLSASWGDGPFAADVSDLLGGISTWFSLAAVTE